jgi:hypothetical protein
MACIPEANPKLEILNLDVLCIEVLPSRTAWLLDLPDNFSLPLEDTVWGKLFLLT